MCGLGAEGPVQSDHCEGTDRRVTAEREKSILKTAGVKANRRSATLDAVPDGAFRVLDHHGLFELEIRIDALNRHQQRQKRPHTAGKGCTPRVPPGGMRRHEAEMWGLAVIVGCINYIGNRFREVKIATTRALRSW